MGKIIWVLIASIILFVIISLYYMFKPEEIHSPEVEEVGNDETIIDETP